ncbi:hypothetical protein JMUB7530_27730 [Staphylococcus aureus]
MTKHNNIYKHGRKSYQYDWFYHSKAWKKLREIALDRDNYLCQMCLREDIVTDANIVHHIICLLYTSPSPRDMRRSRMPSSA